MNKTLKLATITLALVLIGAVAAVLTQPYIFNNHAIVSNTATLAFTFDGASWDGTSPVDWGTISKDAIYTYDLDVTNTGDFDLTLTVTLVNLPTGFTCIWTLDGTTLAIGATELGTLELTVDSTAVVGTYNWEVHITGEEI